MILHYRKQYIESMKELINRYEASIELGISKSEYEYVNKMLCLLCSPIGVVQETGCSTCPWVVITGVSCGASQSRDRQGEFIYESENKGAQIQRIDQLREWIEIYENSEGYNE